MAVNLLRGTVTENPSLMHTGCACGCDSWQPLAHRHIKNWEIWETRLNQKYNPDCIFA